MSNSVYPINKGVNRAIMFRGLKAQWIWWLCGGLLSLMLLFTILYLLSVPLLICTLIVLVSGTCLFPFVYKMNSKYGEHGWTKKTAAKYIPSHVKCDQIFK